MRFHHGTEAGDIIFRTGSDTCSFQNLLQQGLFISVSALVTLVLMPGVMWKLNSKLTMILLGGVRLSVGERQRINLARAFLKDAPILLMDEPTSALDVDSESQVVESLGKSMDGRTSVMVAHRLTTNQRVSRILVLEKGFVKENGTPEELMAQKGYYWRVIVEQVKSNQAILRSA